MPSQANPPTINRALLEQGGLRSVIGEQQAGVRPWTDAQLQASIAQVLPAAMTRDGVWIFAYGSLIWNPCMEPDERVRATLYGRRRALVLRSRVGRGSPELPGLLLGLAPGGSCQGLALRVAPSRAAYEMTLLWRREMVMGSYRPRVLIARAGAQRLPVIVFDGNPGHPNYCEPACIDSATPTIRRAAGFSGTNADYMLRTQAALREHGLTDRWLDALCARLRETGHA